MVRAAQTDIRINAQDLLAETARLSLQLLVPAVHAGFERVVGRWGLSDG
jgi:hypothetical protein